MTFVSTLKNAIVNGHNYQFCLSYQHPFANGDLKKLVVPMDFIARFYNKTMSFARGNC